MFGLSSKKSDDKLPIFVHDIKSTDAFLLAQKVWQANLRYVRQDTTNKKDLLHFGFPNPACTVWLQHDQGRDDTYELILIWKSTGVSEVYVLSLTGGRPVGDDTRAKQLLGTILSTPSTVPSA